MKNTYNIYFSFAGSAEVCSITVFCSSIEEAWKDLSKVLLVEKNTKNREVVNVTVRKVVFRS